MCDTCEVQSRYADLWPDNQDAWTLWGQIARRTVVDLKLASWVLDQATHDLDPDEKLHMLTRLETIRSVIDPPKAHGET